jgi:DNA-binding response OmpR family regulator
MEGQRGRILVIEDDDKLGRMVGRALAPDHDIEVVTRARDALGRIAAGERFDLVLCDLMLEGVSGIEVYERVGQIAPELVGRIVFMTAGAVTPRAAAFLGRPDIRHIEKPFPSLAEFRAVVQAHLARTTKARSPWPGRLDW